MTKEKMSETIKGYIDYITKTRTDTLNAIFEPVVIDCDPEEPSITISFPITDNMQNTSGMAHGGVLMTAYDITMGTIARWFQHGRMSPTLTMTIDFVLPVRAGTDFIVTAKPVALAKHTMDFECVGRTSEDLEKIVNRCTGRFFVYDAVDEKFITRK